MKVFTSFFPGLQSGSKKRARIFYQLVVIYFQKGIIQSLRGQDEGGRGLTNFGFGLCSGLRVKTVHVEGGGGSKNVHIVVE